MNKGKLRVAGRVLAIGSLAVLLAACMKLDMDLTISSDNTVSGSLIFAMDKSVLEMTGASPEDFSEGVEGLPAGAEVSDYEDGEWVGQEYTFNDMSLDEFNTDSDFTIVREGDKFVVSGEMDLSGDTSGLEGMEGTEDLMGSAEIRIALTFPGKVESGTGDISGKTITWEPAFGSKTSLEAVASAIDSGGGMTTWILIAAAVVVLVVVLLVVMSKRSKPAAVGVGDVAGGTAGFESGAPAAPEAPATPAAPEPPAPPAAPEAPAPPASEGPASEGPASEGPSN